MEEMFHTLNCFQWSAAHCVWWGIWFVCVCLTLVLLWRLFRSVPVSGHPSVSAESETKGLSVILLAEHLLEENDAEDSLRAFLNQEIEGFYEVIVADARVSEAQSDMLSALCVRLQTSFKRLRLVSVPPTTRHIIPTALARMLAVKAAYAPCVAVCDMRMRPHDTGWAARLMSRVGDGVQFVQFYSNHEGDTAVSRRAAARRFVRFSALWRSARQGVPSAFFRDGFVVKREWVLSCGTQREDVVRQWDDAVWMSALSDAASGGSVCVTADVDTRLWLHGEPERRLRDRGSDFVKLSSFSDRSANLVSFLLWLTLFLSLALFVVSFRRAVFDEMWLSLLPAILSPVTFLFSVGLELKIIGKKSALALGDDPYPWYVLLQSTLAALPAAFASLWRRHRPQIPADNRPLPR